MQNITFTFDTIPGQTMFQEGQSELRPIFFVVIVTEGSQEELDYMRYIKQLVNNQPDVSFEIILLNDYISDTKQRISYSNPLHRVKAMLDWKKNNLSAYGTNADDVEWLICDRDNGSFTEEQYDEMLRQSESEDFKVVVSNPAFQLWLLFHFVDNIDSLKLGTKKHSCDQIAIIEKKLKEYIPYYEHGSINMEEFAAFVEDAILNSQKYPMGVTVLKNSFGTNFSELLANIKSWSGINTLNSNF